MSVNKVILVGRLGQDPETRAFPNGGSICNISIATSESWKDKQSGERQERTEWHRVVLRNKLGEIAQQYLRKGGQVYIEGRLQTRKWQNQQGQDQYMTEIIASNMTMLGSGGGDNQGKSSGSNQSQNPHANRQQQAPASAYAGANYASGEADYYDDDIPF